MSCTGTSDCLCGCCSGTAVQTPACGDNLPGLPAIAYRSGTWATFKTSMLARLSSADYPALAALKTRNDDDFSIALVDASSVMLDILTFYQERLANESYLRTAAQLPSLTELARLIGYQPAPGVGSSVYSVVHAAGRAGVPGGSVHHRHHHSEGHAGAERAGPGTDAADVRDILGPSRQSRLERAAGADRGAVDPEDGRPRGLSTRHGDAAAAGRRDSDRRRRAAGAGTQHRSALGSPHHHRGGDGYRGQPHLRHVECAVGRCRGRRRAGEQESRVLRAAPACVAVRVQRGEPADADGGDPRGARRRS